MGKTLGSLYTCLRELLRRRQWKLGVTIRNFFLMVKFSKFLGSICFKSLKGRVDGVEVPFETHAVAFVSDMHCMGLQCNFVGEYFATGNLFGSLKCPWEFADFTVRKWNVCSANPRACFVSQQDF